MFGDHASVAGQLAAARRTARSRGDRRLPTRPYSADMGIFNVTTSSKENVKHSQEQGFPGISDQIQKRPSARSPPQKVQTN